MRSILSLVTIAFLILCTQPTENSHNYYDDLQQGSIDNLTSNEKQIINLLASESCGQITLISDSTIIGNVDTSFIRNSYTFPLALQKKYDEINQKRSYIGNINLGITHDYRYFDLKHQDSIFTGDIGTGWNTFYKRYPVSHGYLCFSTIAFNDDSTKALLRIQKNYGSLGADNGFVSMLKVNGVWKKLAYVIIWVS